MEYFLIITFGILIIWLGIYISILFLGYYWGSVKYFAERTYYKKKKIYGNPENYI